MQEFASNTSHSDYYDACVMYFFEDYGIAEKNEGPGVCVSCVAGSHASIDLRIGITGASSSGMG
ncbi:MAG: hypothetical protein AB8B87_16150 [Granulosicoccus sp.]